MEFSEVLKARRSTRQFTDDTVSREQIMKLLEAAIAAPNACNMQSWHFYVVTDKDIKKQINDEGALTPWATTAPVIFVVCSDATEIVKRFGERAEKLFAVQDTAAAIENLLLCAADMGLGGCFMGAFDPEKIRKILNIPPQHNPLAVVPVGKPAMILPPRPRNPLEMTVTFVGDLDGAEYSELDTAYRKYEVKNSKLHESVFDNAEFNRSTFKDLDMSGSTFENINFSEAVFKNCSFEGATVDGKKVK